jgi:uncharacterized protein YjlB
MAQVETHTFEDAGGIPNSRLPVLVYHDVQGAREADECKELFARNGWLGAWLDGIYPLHHFHSTAHEVLGIVAGSAAVVLGGPSGRRFQVRRGNVLVLPAGTGHCNAGSSDQLGPERPTGTPPALREAQKAPVVAATLGAIARCDRWCRSGTQATPPPRRS